MLESISSDQHQWALSTARECSGPAAALDHARAQTPPFRRDSLMGNVKKLTREAFGSNTAAGRACLKVTLGALPLLILGLADSKHFLLCVNDT